MTKKEPHTIVTGTLPFLIKVVVVEALTLLMFSKRSSVVAAEGVVEFLKSYLAEGVEEEVEKSIIGVLICDMI